MKKFMQTLIGGAVVGITIGFLIALTFSLIYQTSNFYPSAPRFVAMFNNQVTATLVSTILWALIGIMFNFASLVFEQAQWSLTKQTLIHLVVTFSLFTPLAILSGWFPLNWSWLLFFTIVYAAIYISIWISSMIAERQTIAHINRALSKQHNR